jgi:hypothetical protein
MGHAPKVDRIADDAFLLTTPHNYLSRIGKC